MACRAQEALALPWWLLQVDELKKRSEDLKREAYIRKRHQEEHKRRMAELELRKVDADKEFSSLEEAVQVRCNRHTHTHTINQSINE